VIVIICYSLSFFVSGLVVNYIIVMLKSMLLVFVLGNGLSNY